MSRELVLHVIDSLDISGGAERQLVANLRSFDHELMEHRVAVVKRTPTTREDEVRPYAQVHYLIPGQTEPARLQIISQLRRLVRELRPSLIHASLPDSALASRIVARLERVAAVESLVNISHERIRTVDNPHVTTRKLRVHTMLDRLTMKSLTGFHAVSQAVADSWAEVVGLDRSTMKVIPRGIDASTMELSEEERLTARESVLEEFRLPGDSVLAISVGRVEPQKGHRYLVKAVAHLTADLPQLRVLIVGRGGHASMAVESAIRTAKLDEVVLLAGPRSDLPRLLAAADIFVFPSLFEGNGGNAMIEAMIAGLPIITTNKPPMTDLVPDESTGLLVDRCRPDQLAAAMRRLLNDEELRRTLGKAARTRATGFPSSSEIARSHEQWYSELIRERLAIRDPDKER